MARYEGDNTVLLQQTSQWLLGVWREGGEGRGVESPADTLSWLPGWREVEVEATTPEGALAALRCLVVRLLERTAAEVSSGPPSPRWRALEQLATPPSPSAAGRSGTWRAPSPSPSSAPWSCSGSCSWWSRRRRPTPCSPPWRACEPPPTPPPSGTPPGASSSTRGTSPSMVSSHLPAWPQVAPSSPLLPSHSPPPPPPPPPPVRAEVVALCEELVPEAVLLTDVLAPPGQLHLLLLPLPSPLPSTLSLFPPISLPLLFRAGFK